MSRLYVGGLGNKPEIVSYWKHGSMPNMNIEIGPSPLFSWGGKPSVLCAWCRESASEAAVEPEGFPAVRHLRIHEASLMGSKGGISKGGFSKLCVSLMQAPSICFRF